MNDNRHMRELEQAVEAFRACIWALPEELFLKPIVGWSPRDVVAHLIGWNRYTIGGCRQILSGRKPFYFEDAHNDYSNVNADSVQRYSSTSRPNLMTEFGRSSEELRLYLLSLDLSEWETDHGIRHGRWAITVRNTIGALRSDYDAHRQEIEQWASRFERTG